MTKPTKLETLNQNLEVAKKAFEQAVLRLNPQIVAERAVVDQLQAVYRKADKARHKGYENTQAVHRAVEARLFPVEVRVRLQVAIKEKVAQFPEADAALLAREYQSRQIAADPEVVAAEQAFRDAAKAAEKANREYNVISGFGGKLYKLTRELDGFREVVERLEKEVERLPRYRQAAKDRRADERQEQVVADQTAAARAVLADFRF